MGAAIAAQLAGAGWDAALLDVTEAASQAGLARLKSAKPALLWTPEDAERIHAGAFVEGSAPLRDADWVVEAVAEKMDTKRAIFAALEREAGPDAIISSNTSGLSLREMTD